MEEKTIGTPIGSAGFKDVKRRGLERYGQTLTFFDEPQSIWKMLVLHLAMAEDLLTMGQRVDKGGMADLLVRVDTARKIESIFQRFAPIVVVAKGIVLIFKAGIEQTSKSHGHGYSPPF